MKSTILFSRAKQLGIYMYIYTGGRTAGAQKMDITRLCEKHSDCVFLCFTNATLIDEAFADEMLRVKNFVPAISLEGFEDATDSRRGTGVYQKVIDAIGLLRRKKLLYGISACYTSANFDSITSEAFFDKLIELGVYFIWYFHYMPVGNDASPPCCPLRSSVSKLTAASANTAPRNLCSPWISRMMPSLWMAASPAAGAICTSTLTAMWIPAFLYTILIPIFAKRRCCRRCSPP